MNMNTTYALEKLIEQLQRNPIHNYIVPGLTSWLLVEHPNAGGMVRLFEASREQRLHVTPHSHRFDFTCYVIEGSVENQVWHRSTQGDEYMEQTMTYLGGPGKYEIRSVNEKGRWVYDSCVYGKGELYSMKHDEIHSIIFTRNARVLFFEGPHVTNDTVILEPVVGSAVIHTMTYEPWMFQRGAD